jgi:predicted dienelactone hydrolase
LRLALFGLVATAITFSLHAQQRIDVPREDGATTPLLIYPASTHIKGCAPLAVISHGAGKNEFDYRYLAEGMANMGYTAIVMGHRESSLPVLQEDIRARGPVMGVVSLVASPYAEGARLMDVDATLKWADTRCRAPFRVLLGHSMGAETVMLEAGAKDMILMKPALLGRSRFDAYVALSPEGHGIIFPEDAWSGIHKPILFITGTKDKSLKGGVEARSEPWKDVPGLANRCQWQGIIDGAVHFDFDGTGPATQQVQPIVLSTIASFLKGVRSGHCSVPEPISHLTLEAK